MAFSFRWLAPGEGEELLASRAVAAGAPAAAGLLLGLPPQEKVVAAVAGGEGLVGWGEEGAIAGVDGEVGEDHAQAFVLYELVGDHGVLLSRAESGQGGL